MLTEIDHTVLAVEDLDMAEHFYVNVLGQIIPASIRSRSMRTTDTLIRAGRLRARGHNEARVPAGHSNVNIGDTVLALFLQQGHVQEPPPEQLRGVPRICFHVTAEQIDRAVGVFRLHKVPFDGPVEYAAPSPVARSIYFKDPSRNFLELSSPREA